MGDARKNDTAVNFIGYGPVPELQSWIERSPFAGAEVRHQVLDPEMHLHLVLVGAGMSILPLWSALNFPELEHMPGTELDKSRSTWVVPHEGLRDLRRVRIFVDFLAQALIAQGRTAR